MDPGLRMRQEFAAQQQAAMYGARVGRARRNLVGLSAGAFAGIVGVGAAAVTGELEFAWHTFLLEACLSAFMGLVLVIVGGGLLKGAFLLPLAYGAAYLLRDVGYDPALWFGGEAGPGPIQGTGHLVATCTLLACGGILGYVIESRNT